MDWEPPEQRTFEPRMCKMKDKFELFWEEDTFEFRSYSPYVFEAIRVMYGISNQSFRQSLRSISGGAKGEGKSGMLFFVSHDKKYVIKTLKENEKNWFRDIVGGYAAHLRTHADTSLLCRFYFMGKIRFSKKEGWVRVVVMKNTFDTPLPLHAKYDLKGSTKNRFVSAAEQEEQSSGATGEGVLKVAVLKDLNFKGRICLDGDDHAVFVKQVRLDCAFLAQHNIMDYSLLLGIHQPRKTRNRRASPGVQSSSGGGGGGGGAGGRRGQSMRLSSGRDTARGAVGRRTIMSSPKGGFEPLTSGGTGAEE